MRMKTFFSFIIALCLAMFIAGTAMCAVTVKIVVANPSDSETRTVPVRFDLPEDIERDDIVDTGGLKSDYDVKKGVYYVHGELDLEPKETRTLEVVVNDVWKIPEEEIQQLLKTVDDKVASINNADTQQAAQLIGDHIKERLNSIRETQSNLAADIEKRMQVFPTHRERVRQIKDEIFSLESLAEIGAGEEATRDETVTLVIEAENTAERELTIPLQYYLPKEVVPEYVVDSNIFDLKFDVDKTQFFLSAEETFGPREIKRFEIEIKNVWYVSRELLDRYLAEATSLNEQLADSSLAEIAATLFNEIEQNIILINESQEEFTSITDHIAKYRLNSKRLRIVEEDLDRLRRLALRKDDGTQMKMAKELQSAQDVLKKVERITNIKLTEIAKDLVEKLKQIGVWRVVYTVVMFLVALTTFFYFVWFTRLKKEEKQKVEKVEVKESEKA